MGDISFSRIIRDIGQAGVELTTLGATEGSAGNISVLVRELRDLDSAFAARDEIEIPAVTPELAGAWVLVTGAGRRLRDVSTHPEQNVVVLHIHDDGARATWHAAVDLRPSSEWNSHLAVHADQVAQRGVPYHAMVHAQPLYLTYLSHHPAYATADRLNQHLLRWEPETVITFPEGIGLIPFEVPGSAPQMRGTVSGLRTYRLVVWQKHGVVARSDTSASHAADLVEYAETAARYEMLNLQLGTPAAGLSDEELRAVCVDFHVPVPPFLSGVR